MRSFLAALAVAFVVFTPPASAVSLPTELPTPPPPVGEILKKVEDTVSPIEKEIKRVIEDVEETMQDEPEDKREPDRKQKEQVDNPRDPVVKSNTGRRQPVVQPSGPDPDIAGRPLTGPNFQPMPDQATPIPTPQVAPTQPPDTEIDRPLDLGLPFDPLLFAFATVLGTLCLIAIYVVYYKWQERRDIKDLQDILNTARKR